MIERVQAFLRRHSSLLLVIGLAVFFLDEFFFSHRQTTYPTFARWHISGYTPVASIGIALVGLYYRIAEHPAGKI